jgi:hypothetical protein
MPQGSAFTGPCGLRMVAKDVTSAILVVGVVSSFAKLCLVVGRWE